MFTKNNVYEDVSTRKLLENTMYHNSQYKEKKMNGVTKEVKEHG